jgi:hypothetical protein
MVNGQHLSVNCNRLRLAFGRSIECELLRRAAVRSPDLARLGRMFVTITTHTHTHTHTDIKVNLLCLLLVSHNIVCWPDRFERWQVVDMHHALTFETGWCDAACLF